MSELTKRYVRRPLFVDGVEVTAENMQEVAEWCQGEIRWNDGDNPVTKEELDAAGVEDFKDMYIFVRVHHPKTTKQTQAKIGTWILYAPEQRGYKVYNARAFEATFDPEEEVFVKEDEETKPNNDEETES